MSQPGSENASLGKLTKLMSRVQNSGDSLDLKDGFDPASLLPGTWESPLWWADDDGGGGGGGRGTINIPAGRWRMNFDNFINEAVQ